MFSGFLGCFWVRGIVFLKQGKKRDAWGRCMFPLGMWIVFAISMPNSLVVDRFAPVFVFYLDLREEMKRSEGLNFSAGISSFRSFHPNWEFVYIWLDVFVGVARLVTPAASILLGLSCVFNNWVLNWVVLFMPRRQELCWCCSPAIDSEGWYEQLGGWSCWFHGTIGREFGSKSKA